MIVSINYKDRQGDGYDSRKYSYFCGISDIRVGDKVIAPTYKGDRDAIVVEVDVPLGSIDPAIIPKLRTITTRLKEDISDGE